MKFINKRLLLVVLMIFSLANIIFSNKLNLKNKTSNTLQAMSQSKDL